MKLTKRQKTNTLLLAVTIVSATSLLYYTARYVEFFKALASFEVAIDEIDFATTQNDLNVAVDLKMSNPTGYGDLQFNGITGTVYYEGEIHTIVISPGGPRIGVPYQEIETNLWQLPDGHVSPIHPVQIQSHSTNQFTMSIAAQGETAREFNDYYEKTAGQQEMRWHISLRVSVTTPTFLKTMELQYDFAR